MNEQITTIKSNSYSVRAIAFEGKAYFSLKDILEVCGCAWPTKWVMKARDTHPNEIQMKKLIYPLMTKGGLRRYEMWFADGENASKAIETLNCSDDKKKWLREEVFTYKFDVKQEARKKNVLDAAPQQAEGAGAPDLNGRIDTILIELLELKKSIVQMAR